MRKTLYLIVVTTIILSCAKHQAQRVPADNCRDELTELVSENRIEESLHIRGRVRIDLPRYRVRGLCTIRSLPGGDLRIDFHHSSLFGSYREDATVFVRGAGSGYWIGSVRPSSGTIRHSPCSGIILDSTCTPMISRTRFCSRVPIAPRSTGRRFHVPQRAAPGAFPAHGGDEPSRSTDGM